MAGGTAHGTAGHVREVVTIDLPREREVTAPEFNEYKRRIDALIHQGDRAAA